MLTGHRKSWAALLVVVVALTGITAAWIVTANPETPSVRKLLSGSAAPAETIVEASNRLNSTSAVNHSGDARFSCRRMYVLNRSNAPLARILGPLVTQALVESTPLEQVEYFPLGKPLPSEQRTPDLFLTLDMTEYHETTTDTALETSADVTVELGTRVVDSNNGYSGHLSAPIVNLRWHGDLHHTSTTQGNVADRPAAVAANIADEITRKLKGQFEDWTKKYANLPEVPEAFYPAYRPAPLQPIVEHFQADLIFAGHGLMNHNQSAWRFTSKQPVNKVLREVWTELEQAGWKVRNLKDDTELNFLRIVDGGVMIEAFPQLQPFGTSRDDSTEPRHRTFYIRYLDRMTQDELQQANAEILTPDTPLETLTLFTRWLSREQRQQAVDLMTENSGKTAQAWLALAELQHWMKRPDDAVASLTRAAVIAKVHTDRQDLQRRIKQLAKSWKIDPLAEPELTDEALQDVGFKHLQPGDEFESTDLKLSQPLNLYVRTADNELVMLSLQLRPEPRGQIGYAFVKARTHTWSRNTSSSLPRQFNSNISEAGRLTLTIDPTDDDATFEISGKLVPLRSDSTPAKTSSTDE